MLLFPGFVSLSDSFSSFVDLIRGSSHSLSPELSTYIKIRRQLAAPRALRTEFDEKKFIKQNVKLLAIPESRYKASRQKKKKQLIHDEYWAQTLFLGHLSFHKRGKKQKKERFPRLVSYSGAAINNLRVSEIFFSPSFFFLFSLSGRNVI